MAEGKSNGGLSGAEAVRAAREVLQEITGRKPEAVSGLNRQDEGGWTVAIDVVELSRIPPSTDVLATYHVTIDQSGELVDVQRGRRYFRNQTDEE
jgi:hypothetical protein